MTKENPMIGIADWLAKEARLEDAQNILKSVDKSVKSTEVDKKTAAKMARELKKKSRELMQESMKMELVWKKTKDLTPHEEIEKLMPIKGDIYASIKDDIDERGILVPIVVEKGKVVCGITRWRAAKELGIEDIPCFEASFIAYQNVLEFAIKDNVMRRQLSYEERTGLMSHMLRVKDVTLPGRPPLKGTKREVDAAVKKAQKVMAAPVVAAKQKEVKSQIIEASYTWVVGKDGHKDSTYAKTVAGEVEDQLDLLNVKGNRIDVYIRYEVQDER